MLKSKLYSYVHGVTLILAATNVLLVSLWTGIYLGGFATSKDPLHHFNYHPLLSVLGLIVLYGEGLLLFRSFSSRTKTALKLFHSMAMFIVFVLTVISLNCVFNSHNKRPIPIPNLYSMHSWIGLGTVILFSFQFACGFFTFMYPGIHAVYRASILPFHKFLGITIFALSILSCHSGIMEKSKASLKEKYMELPPAAYIANFLAVSLTLYGILVVYLASTADFKRVPLPEENRLQLEMHNNVA